MSIPNPPAGFVFPEDLPVGHPDLRPDPRFERDALHRYGAHYTLRRRSHEPGATEWSRLDDPGRLTPEVAFRDPETGQRRPDLSRAEAHRRLWPELYADPAVAAAPAPAPDPAPPPDQTSPPAPDHDPGRQFVASTDSPHVGKYLVVLLPGGKRTDPDTEPDPCVGKYRVVCLPDSATLIDSWEEAVRVARLCQQQHPDDRVEIEQIVSEAVRAEDITDNDGHRV